MNEYVNIKTDNIDVNIPTKDTVSKNNLNYYKFTSLNINKNTSTNFILEITDLTSFPTELKTALTNNKVIDIDILFNSTSNIYLGNYEYKGFSYSSDIIRLHFDIAIPSYYFDNSVNNLNQIENITFFWVV